MWAPGRWQPGLSQAGAWSSGISVGPLAGRSDTPAECSWQRQRHSMKRPAFQFYPADWRNNANLRRCSWEARGVWIEVMGLMHDSDCYGLLRWPLREIAQAIGAPAKLLQELAVKGVLKGADSGQIETFVYTPRSGRKDGDPVAL